MLFDLRSPGRRNVIRVVYAMLAVLMGGGLVLFGIGGSGSGIFDAFSDSGGGGGGNPFEDDINAAQERVQQNPKDEAAYATLVQLHYSAGTQQVDENGALTTDGEEELQQAADAWAKYLKLSGGDPATSPNLLAVQALSTLAQNQIQDATQATSTTDALTDATASQANWAAAAEAEKLALARGGQNQQGGSGYQNLALFYYAAGDVQAGDQATAQAVQQAQGPEKETIQKSLDSIKQQAAQINTAIASLQKQQKQASTSPSGGAAGGSNPLEGVGGGLGSGGLSGGGLSSP
jgi:hypothetical protein